MSPPPNSIPKLAKIPLTASPRSCRTRLPCRTAARQAPRCPPSFSQLVVPARRTCSLFRTVGVAALLASACALDQCLQGQFGARVGIAAQPLGAAWGVDAARLALQTGAHRAAAAARLPDQLRAGSPGPGRRGLAGGQALQRAGRTAEQHLGAYASAQQQQQRRQEQRQRGAAQSRQHVGDGERDRSEERGQVALP